ncbi:MAG: D-alanyl-D-alanine carboxypeptidase/D-alanyl-D-alanine-endopeptidase [Mediterranea sp.]|jgi:D-alanyl-D-alanine carboxypeptidase/D-alanyl-D-alanine-endopeptidase (penicillin-binding protein 4)|nr:D-alanyl-D-alanine carboxypeptidase/D-alanyl-D-alanine-endopeptidase [Mediterranea sp.]
MKKIGCWLLASMLASPAWGQEPLAEIDSLIKRMLPESSEVGIAVYDLTAKRRLYAYRAEKLSRPASTLKLLTAITALARPDADQPFRTEVRHDGVIARDTLHGNLYVVGGFDPELDGEALDSLVERTASRGFSVITGGVYGDVSLKDSLRWGQGWAWDDEPAAFQPHLSPLMLCKGTVEITVGPTPAKGDTAAILAAYPRSSFYTLRNETKSRTPSAGDFALTRDWMEHGNHIVVSGNVDKIRKGQVSVYDSPRFFMRTFLDRLQARGIAPKDTILRFAELPADSDSVRVSAPLAVWETPMYTVLRQLMKNSDNLNAEALLCRVGAEASGKRHVAAEDGIVEIMKLVRQLGHDPKTIQIADGCGLSNYNYLSPSLLVDFLAYAYSRADIFNALYRALPTGGVDGTLKYRMRKAPTRGNVHAKTGSFTAINTLAGYIDRQDGHTLAFAIMNQNILSAKQARDFQDEVCGLLLRYADPDGVKKNK